MTGPASGPEVVDLVVVGSGAAGLTGALTAALGGLRTVVLEKTALVGGTTALSGGTVWLPVNHRMAEVGVTDSTADALTYLRAAVAGAGDDSHLVALAESGAEVLRVLEDGAGVRLNPFLPRGGSIDYRPWLPGARRGGRALTSRRVALAELPGWAHLLRKAENSAWSHDPRDYFADGMHLLPPGAAPPGPDAGEGAVGRGAALVAQLLRGCLTNGVDVRLSTAATRLVVDGDAVTGVRAEGPGGVVTVLGRRGVLLATGGYSHNEELCRLWLDRPVDFSCELDTNRGDGHLMGLAAGAEVAGLGDAWWMPRTPETTVGGPVNSASARDERVLPHTLMVDARGCRFMNEAVNYHDAGQSFDRFAGSGPRRFPAWLVFDGQGADRYALLRAKLDDPVAREWFRCAGTLEGLAAGIGVDPAALVSTVDRFNGYARRGVDEDFHRGESEWDRAWGDPTQQPNPSLGTVEKPPFAAVRVHSGTLATRGGLRVDRDARVYSAATNAPFAGLYAAGNCSNGGPAGAYPGPGATLGAALTFGYLAGRHAAGRSASNI